MVEYEGEGKIKTDAVIKRLVLIFACIAVLFMLPKYGIDCLVLSKIQQIVSIFFVTGYKDWACEHCLNIVLFVKIVKNVSEREKIMSKYIKKLVVLVATLILLFMIPTYIIDCISNGELLQNIPITYKGIFGMIMSLLAIYFNMKLADRYSYNKSYLITAVLFYLPYAILSDYLSLERTFVILNFITFCLIFIGCTSVVSFFVYKRRKSIRESRKIHV